MKTTIHTYSYDVRNPADAAAYKMLCDQLTAAGSVVFCTWGGKGHYEFVKPIDGATVELETVHLFDNQWNTAPIGESESGLRVFDWAEDYPINFSKSIKKGHYLVITDEMRAARENRCKCGYCGAQYEKENAPKFCGKCIDSAYLKPNDLHMLRIMPLMEEKNGRAPLSDDEKAELLPRYRAAQIHGESERGKARIEKQKRDIENKYAAAVRKATVERDAARWIIANIPGILDNWIYYDHTGRHSFGWRTPISAELLNDLLSLIGEFPFDYEIKCADGRTLSN